MPPYSSTKRIRILPETEIDDLFAVPKFSDDERLIWFELNQDEQDLLESKNSIASSVDLIIPLIVGVIGFYLNAKKIRLILPYSS